MSEKKKTGIIKESFVNALNVVTGESSNAGVGVSIPKDIWEKFIVEIQARNLKVHVEADGPQITNIKVYD